jgi:hypothetical protein
VKNKNKKLVIIGVIFLLISLFIISKLSSSPLNPDRDIVLEMRDYREPTHFLLDSTKLPTIGVSTEEDVYKLLGKDLDRRWTFKTVREKKVNGETFRYNKIIVYQDTYYKFSSEERNGTIISRDVPLEQSQLVIFLLDGKVTFFSALNETRPNGDADYVPTDKSVNLNEKDEVWPEAEKDFNDYFQENGLRRY